MSRQSKRTARVIARYIITFVLMLCLMGISLLGYGKYSMLSVHGVVHSCERVEYFEDICKEMKNEAYYLGIPYGISKKELSGVFDKKEVTKDIVNIIVAKKKGDIPRIDSYDVRKKIEENVAAKNGTLTEEQKKSLNAYITQVERMYQKKIVIPGIDYIVEMIRVTDKVAIIGIPVLLLLAIICIFYLISSRRYVYHGLRYVAYGFLGAGITLVTVFAGLISDKSIYRMNISDVYMRKFFTFWIGHEMLMQVFAGIGFLLAGAVVVYLVIRRKFRRR